MKNKDKRIDQYIAKSANFAKPILNHIRILVHKSCPDVEEKMKWSFPHFVYKGMMCAMAAFKQHCAFGFWKGSLMKDPYKVMDKGREEAMGQFRRITKLSDLPNDKILIAYIKEAIKLNEEGVKLPGRKKTEKKELKIPGYFLKEVKKNKKALSVFEKFSYSNQKEYVEWVTEAKTEDTRNTRLQTTVEWLAEGKIRNWKYLKK